MTKKKNVNVTMGMFNEAILPRFDEVIEERLNIHDEKMENKLREYRHEVVGFKEGVMGEIQKLRDEVLITGHHYEKTNKRVDLIDKKVGIDTSVVF